MEQGPGAGARRPSNYGVKVQNAPTIPVAFTFFDIGRNLYNQYQQAVQNNTTLQVYA